MKRSIILLFLLKLVFSLLKGLSNSKFNPGRILWSQESWHSSPFELVRTNGGILTTVIVWFRVTTSIENGYIEMTFPPNLSGPIYTSMTLSADKDQSISFIFETPATLALYGPFGLVTRTSSTGQIVDANTVFGFIPISQQISSISQLTVNSFSGNQSPVIETSDSLLFTFSLTKSLWKYDIIEIIPDVDWKISSSVICESIGNNLLFGKNNENLLPCALAAMSTDDTGPSYIKGETNSIYVYGIENDVFIANDPAEVTIKISIFTLPGYTKPSANNYWIVNIWRYGTTNLLAKYTGSGPITPVPGAIVFNSWVPISDIDKSIIPAEITLFTKMTFTNSHKIPENGQAVITLPNVGISSIWWQDLDGTNQMPNQCYLATLILGADCKILSSSILEITFKYGLPASQSISIILLTYLNWEARIESIQTFYSSSIIDEIYDPYFWPFNNNNKRLGNFKYHAYSRDNIAPYPSVTADPIFEGGWLNGADIESDLYWALHPQSDIWTTDTVIDIHLPISQSLDFKKSYIAQDAQIYSLIDQFSSTNFLISPPANADITLGNNKITVRFTDTPPADNYLVFSYSGNSALPYVASNLATFYECWVITTTGSTHEVENSIFSVLVKDYAETDIYAKPLCVSENSGIPLVTLFTAKLMAFDFSSTGLSFGIDIEIPNLGMLGTNLISGSPLPCASTAGEAYATLSDNNGNSFITVKGLGYISINNSVKVFLTKGHINVGSTLTPTTYFYYKTSEDPTIINYLYKSSGSSYIIEPSVPANLAYSSQAWDISSTSSLIISGISISAFTLNGWYIGISLPAGFKLQGSRISANDQFPQKSYQVVMNDEYSYGGFIMGISDDIFNIRYSGSSLKVDNIESASYAGPINGANNVKFTFFVITPEGATINSDDSSHIQSWINVGTIRDADVECKTSAKSLAGPNSVDSTMTIKISIPHNIPIGGVITLIMDNSWSFTYATCSVAGLNWICTIGAITTINVSSYFHAGKITVTFLHIQPPISNTQVGCITSITTQDSYGNYIDSGSFFSQSISLLQSASVQTSTTLSI